MGKREWAVVGGFAILSTALALFWLRPVPPCGWGERPHCHIDSQSGVAPRPGEPSQTSLHCPCGSRFGPAPICVQPP